MKKFNIDILDVLYVVSMLIMLFNIISAVVTNNFTLMSYVVNAVIAIMYILIAEIDNRRDKKK